MSLKCCAAILSVQQKNKAHTFTYTKAATAADNKLRNTPHVFTFSNDFFDDDDDDELCIMMRALFVSLLVAIKENIIWNEYVRIHTQSRINGKTIMWTGKQNGREWERALLWLLLLLLLLLFHRSDVKYGHGILPRTYNVHHSLLALLIISCALYFFDPRSFTWSLPFGICVSLSVVFFFAVFCFFCLSCGYWADDLYRGSVHLVALDWLGLAEQRIQHFQPLPNLFNMVMACTSFNAFAKYRWATTTTRSQGYDRISFIIVHRLS